MMEDANEILNWPEAVVAIVIMVLIWSGTVAVVVQLMITWRARMKAAREEQYRRIAEEAIQSQQNVEKALKELAGELKKNNQATHITRKAEE